jgi:dienelactone hydrolase
MPAQGFDLVSEDVAAATSRTQIYTNPGDEPSGFRRSASASVPRSRAQDGAARMPVAILLGWLRRRRPRRHRGRRGDARASWRGASRTRASGRAIRQARLRSSGGRPESATLTDYAEDVRAVVKWVADRKDVDDKRIALVGHSEGAWVGMLAAGRDDKIAALVSLAGPATTGGELLLEQQRRHSTRCSCLRGARITRGAAEADSRRGGHGQGLGHDSSGMRRQADTPWFQSVLLFDPASTIRRVKQPMLLVHGALDQQVPVAHAERLAAQARKESRSKSVDLVIVKGVNHLMAPATTGEVAEYATLTDRNVSMDVSAAVTGWLTRTFQAIK